MTGDEVTTHNTGGTMSEHPDVKRNQDECETCYMNRIVRETELIARAVLDARIDEHVLDHQCSPHINHGLGCGRLAELRKQREALG